MFLITTRNLREGLANEPVVSHTLLGWVVHGLTSPPQPIKRSLRISEASIYTRDTHVDQKGCNILHDMFKRYFALESLGVATFARKNKPEERARSILENTTRSRGGSKKAYVTVVYSHAISKDGIINTRIVASKSYGPMTLTIGRHREKRWGVLFTFLIIREVHLEIADSLSA